MQVRISISRISPPLLLCTLLQASRRLRHPPLPLTELQARAADCVVVLGVCCLQFGRCSPWTGVLLDHRADGLCGLCIFVLQAVCVAVSRRVLQLADDHMYSRWEPPDERAVPTVILDRIQRVASTRKKGSRCTSA